MKKLLAFLTALILLAASVCAAAEETGDPVYFSKAWLTGSAYGYGTTVAFLMAANDPGHGSKTPEQIAGEIRFCHFDEAAGLYAAGDGEPAGDRAEIRSVSGNRINYVLRLKEPGKYIISGTAYYLLDAKVPAQAALRAELDGAVIKAMKKTEKETAKALHDWICSRVSPTFPEQDAERLSAVCGDPMNAR